MRNLWSLIFSFSKMRAKYGRLVDSEEGENSAAFGVKGIVYALLTGAFLTLCYFAFNLTFAGDWTAVFGFILLILGAGGALLFFLHGVYATILQLKLNRKAVGILSLLFQLGAFAAAVVVVLVVNNVAIA